MSWSERRKRRFTRTCRVTLASLTLTFLVAAGWNNANPYLPEDLRCDPVTLVCVVPPFESEPVMDRRLSTVTTTVKNRHPLPCIRKYEGTYADGKGKYRTAYQFQESTYKSVGNKRQDALWPVLHKRENWARQDQAAWRLYERRGLSRWSNKVRRECR